MIKTNLIVGISEDAIGGDADVITLKTTSIGSVIIESSLPKVAVKLQDLKDALNAIEDFISDRPIIVEANDNLQTTFEFEYQPSIGQ